MVVIASSDTPAAGCGRGGAELAGLAADALAGPVPIRTHVIGVGAPSAELDQLAAAGGTGQASYVAADADLTTSVAAALIGVRDQHRCTLAGDHQRLDPLPLAVASLTVNQATVPRVDACAPGGAGWMIDHTSTWAPTIHLCDAACDAVWAPTLTEGPTVHAQVTCAP
jgi:hypothetical protein